MSKKMVSCYILFAVFAGVVIAWQTLSNYFTGVGVAFVLLLGILGTTIVFRCLDKTLARRTTDLFIISAVFAGFEFIEYFIFEFRVGTFEAWDVFMGIQNVVSLFGLFFLAYIVVRFIMDLKGSKFGFAKKAKEVSNGSLEQKPNENIQHENKANENQQKAKEDAKKALFEYNEDN